MEIVQKRSRFFSVGLAIFSMFFGAGNIVFPLILGEFAKSNHFFGSAGMILSGVLVPLLGMLSIILFEGDYRSFFRKIGKWPGEAMILIILCLIGPLAAIPRCITIGHSTLSILGDFKSLNLLTFSFLNCLLIFVCAIRPSRILDVLGKVLTPILLASLALIVVKGLWSMPTPTHCSVPSIGVFCRGFLEGYNTLDLLASFFFSSAVLVYLREGKEGASLSKKYLVTSAAGGACIAALLISIAYMGFTCLSAGYCGCLQGVAKHQMLGTIAQQVLGPYAGLAVGVAVFFAVFTTEIALAAIFARFLKETVLRNKISYATALIITLSVAFAISSLSFEGIGKLLGPVLQLCYPALIALAVANLLSKLYSIEIVKPLFYGTLGVAIAVRVLFG